MLSKCGRREQCALLTVALGIFCVQLDSFALNLALPDIGASLRAGPALQWTVSAYLLTVGALMLPAGKASDLVGPKTLLTTGLCVFAAGSLWCGTAPSLPFLVAARVLQGVGGAVVMPVGIALLTQTFRQDIRGRALGNALGVGGIATACGPFVGGALTDGLSWRAIFWVNVPICLVAAWLCCRAPATRRLRRQGRASTGGMRSGLRPLLRNRKYVVLTVAGSAANTATVVFLFVAPLCLRTTWDMTPVTAGVVFLVPAVCMSGAGPVAGRARAWEAGGLMAVCLGCAAVALWVAASSAAFPSYVLSLTVCGGTLGLANALTLVATQGVVEPRQAGEASGLTKTSVTVSGGLGMVLTGPVSRGDSRGSSMVAAQDVLVWTAAVCCAAAVFLWVFRLWRRGFAAGC